MLIALAVIMLVVAILVVGRLRSDSQDARSAGLKTTEVPVAKASVAQDSGSEKTYYPGVYKNWPYTELYLPKNGEQFNRYLNRFYPELTYSRAELQGVAQQLCVAVEDGKSPNKLMQKAERSGWDSLEAPGFLAASISAFCPWAYPRKNVNPMSDTWN